MKHRTGLQAAEAAPLSGANPLHEADEADEADETDETDETDEADEADETDEADVADAASGNTTAGRCAGPLGAHGVGQAFRGPGAPSASPLKRRPTAPSRYSMLALLQDAPIPPHQGTSLRCGPGPSPFTLSLPFTLSWPLTPSTYPYPSPYPCP